MGPLNDRQRDEAARLWPVAVRLALAHQAGFGRPDPHRVADIATRAVMGAVAWFDPACGPAPRLGPFVVSAASRLYRRDHARKRAPGRAVVPLGVGDWDDANAPADPRDHVLDADDADEVAAVLVRLPAKLRPIAAGVLAGETQAESAARLGIPQTTVSLRRRQLQSRYSPGAQP